MTLNLVVKLSDLPVKTNRLWGMTTLHEVMFLGLGQFSLPSLSKLEIIPINRMIKNFISIFQIIFDSFNRGFMLQN